MAYTDSHIQTSASLPPPSVRGICSLMICLLIVGGCQNRELRRDSPDISVRHEYQHPAMGTRFRIVVLSQPGSNPEDAVKRAFERIDQIERVASDWNPESEVRTWCRSAPHREAIVVSSDLATLLKSSLRIHDQTQGRFDITLGALTRLWRRCFRAERLPSQEDLELAYSQRGIDSIEVAGRKARLSKAGVSVDLGGIAKGYAVDEALQLLDEFGFIHCLVDGGGDLAFGPAWPGSSGWVVRLPSGVHRFYSPGAVATSGDSARYIEIDSARFSHILNPKTGLGLRNSPWVTVYAEDATTADAFATAYSVPGPLPEESDLGSTGFPRAIQIIDPNTAEVKRWGRFPGRWPIPSGAGTGEGNPPSVPLGFPRAPESD